MVILAIMAKCHAPSVGCRKKGKCMGPSLQIEFGVAVVAVVGTPIGGHQLTMAVVGTGAQVVTSTTNPLFLDWPVVGESCIGDVKAKRRGVLAGVDQSRGARYLTLDETLGPWAPRATDHRGVPGTDDLGPPRPWVGPGAYFFLIEGSMDQGLRATFHLLTTCAFVRLQQTEWKLVTTYQGRYMDKTHGSKTCSQQAVRETVDSGKLLDPITSMKRIVRYLTPSRCQIVKAVRRVISPADVLIT